MSKSAVETSRLTHSRASSSQLSLKSAWSNGPPKTPTSIPTTPVLPSHTDASGIHTRETSSSFDSVQLSPVIQIRKGEKNSPSKPLHSTHRKSASISSNAPSVLSSRPRSPLSLVAPQGPVQGTILPTAIQEVFKGPTSTRSKLLPTAAAFVPTPAIFAPKRRPVSVRNPLGEAVDLKEIGQLTSGAVSIYPDLSGSKKRGWETAPLQYKVLPGTSQMLDREYQHEDEMNLEPGEARSKEEKLISELILEKEGAGLREETLKLKREDARLREEEMVRLKQEEERLHKEEAEAMQRIQEEELAMQKKQEDDARLELERQAQWIKAEEDRLRAIQEKAELDRKERLRVATDVEATRNVQAVKVKFQGSRKRPVPGMLDLSAINKPDVPKAQPSALLTARAITDINTVEYPTGVKSPKPELNIGAAVGRFRYDRDFLLQFMKICVEKPDLLPDLASLGIEETTQTPTTPRGKRRRSSVKVPPTPLITPSTPNINSRTPSGTKTPILPSTPSGAGKSLEERFASGNAAVSRTRSASGRTRTSNSTLPLPIPVMRSTSHGSSRPPSSPLDLKDSVNKTRSLKGRNRNNTSKQSLSLPSSSNPNSNGESSITLLEPSADRWVAKSTTRRLLPEDPESPEAIERKVQGLLNKLTMDKFESISDQLIGVASRSKAESDGRTLISVIKLVFDKATDEAAWSPMYARLCRKMMEHTSPDVRDEGVKSADGQPLAGGQLFRTYLLTRCQTDFERGWSSKEIPAAEGGSHSPGGEVLYSEEYYATQKAKRRGLGLVKFIGELFKLQMLTERIMHKCIMKLLSNPKPEDEDIESLCKLMTTVGQALNASTAKENIEKYFTRIKELAESPTVSIRMQFMLQDLIDLRGRNWLTRNEIPVPSTGAVGVKQKSSQEARTLLTRNGSKRKADHSASASESWNISSSRTTAKPTHKERPASMSRSSTQNIRSLLTRQASENGANTPPASSHSRNAPSRSNRKGSVDSIAAPESSSLSRKKLQLLPRSLPLHEVLPPSKPVTHPTLNGESESGKAISLVKIQGDIKEFFNIRDLTEGEAYFTHLPAAHRHLLVDKLVSKAIDAKENDLHLVAALFSRIAMASVCTRDEFELGFTPTMEILEDIIVDVPTAYSAMARLLHSSTLGLETVKRLGAKIITEGDPVVRPTSKLLKAYIAFSM